MKKKYLVGLLVLVMCFTLFGCGKKNNPELDKIAKKFNNSETVKSYKEYDYDIKAIVKGDTLVISTKNSDNQTSVTYDLVGNILSNEKIKTEDLMATIILVDSIGQLQGYKDGQLAENLNAFPDEVSKYTVDNEGLELKDKNDTMSIKIDISKKIPLIDLSNLYLKADQFDMVKQFIDDKEGGNQTGRLSKLAYDIQIEDDETKIYIGEKDKLTDSSYKSILSALEVVYGVETANKFKTVYPSFKDGKITIDEFTVDTNYKIEDQDNSIFKDTQVALVTVDKSAIK